MKQLFVILLLLFSFYDIYCCNEERKYIVDGIDTFDVVCIVPDSTSIRSNQTMEEKEIGDCLHNEYVVYDRRLYNCCTNDIKLYVKFNLLVDTIVNDTIFINSIEIVEFRDSNGNVVSREHCEEEFRTQLETKVYLYKCRVKRVQLECVAFP